MTTTHLTYSYPLLPRKGQYDALDKVLHKLRTLYNAALEERIDCYRKTGGSITGYDQMKSLTAIRRDDAEYANLPVSIGRQPLMALDRAFKAFFKRVKKGETPGFPRFKGRDRFRMFGAVDGKGWSVQGNRLRVKGIGVPRFHKHRELPSVPKMWTMTRKAGRWHVNFSVEVDCAEADGDRPAVGLDMGVVHLATTSEGSHIPNLDEDAINKKIRKSQRTLARAKRGSGRRRKTKALLARLLEKRTNRRKDRARKVSAWLARTYGAIVVEDLKIRSMMKSGKGTIDEPGTNVAVKSGLNRAIQGAGWRRLKVPLQYKCALNGSQLIEVNPRNTSRTCHECGHVAMESRRNESFRCVSCGHEAHADVNAALNILHRGGVVPEPHNVGHRVERVAGKTPGALGHHWK